MGLIGKLPHSEQREIRGIISGEFNTVTADTVFAITHMLAIANHRDVRQRSRIEFLERELKVKERELRGDK